MISRIALLFLAWSGLCSRQSRLLLLHNSKIKRLACKREEDLSRG